MLITGIYYKKLLTIAGSFFVFLGVLGIFLPIVPTVPFLVIAVFCYSKGSKKHYKWLIKNKFLGKYIEDYHKGRGIPLHAKIIAITTMWFSITFSVIFFVPYDSIKIIMVVVAILVTIYLVRAKTLKK